MKSKLMIATLMLVAGLGTQSFGLELFKKASMSGPQAYETVVGHELVGHSTIGYGEAGADCGCAPKCCAPKCCKMKYYKRVCRTRTKCVKTGCGCCKQRQRVCVTTVSYRRVFFPCKHCPDDLICACERPCSTTTCSEPVCGCE